MDFCFLKAISFPRSNSHHLSLFLSFYFSLCAKEGSLFLKVLVKAKVLAHKEVQFIFSKEVSFKISYSSD